MGRKIHGTIKTKIVDISARDMSFLIRRNKQAHFKIDEKRTDERDHQTHFKG